jgi:hypothetical protein
VRERYLTYLTEKIREDILICLRVVQKSERTSGNMRGIKGKVDKQRVFGVSGGEDENISDGRRS